MSHITFNIRRIWLLFLLSVLLTACASDKEASHTQGRTPQNSEPRDTTPVVHEVSAPGDSTCGSDIVTIDHSNASQGYIVLTYSGTNEKVKFQIETPEALTYTYLVTEYNSGMVFPLTDADGLYTFTLLESVDIEEDLYAIVFQQELDIKIEDEFLPYLTPNIYTTFTSSSDCVVKGAELAADCYCDLDVIENIYLYVTQNITYDDAKAETVSYGYIPEPDETLSTGTGICFDYASLMTAMLRSQRIPTKLEVGYAGEVYHAWISCYVDEIGWVDNIIEFDGEHWSLMDPTLAANNNRKEVQKYIGDGSKYVVKYTY